ncbi:MAG: hypothetical protein JJE51_14715, partial [Thermoanaerobaculia bacterium]|nr:hypothetical protein [Thermoanaerobaculia bacterium]
MSALNRALFGVVVVILSTGSASAVPTDLRVLFDSDNNASTGCNAFGFAGVEHVLTTTLETAGTPRVLSAVRQSCVGGSLASAVVIDNAGWPAEYNASSGNFTVETKVARSLFGTSPPAGMRVRFLATSGSATGSLVRDANGNPILFPVGLSRRRTAPGETPRRVITLDGAI